MDILSCQLARKLQESGTSGRSKRGGHQALQSWPLGYGSAEVQERHSRSAQTELNHGIYCTYTAESDRIG